jgi:hypothetical protein
MHLQLRISHTIGVIIVITTPIVNINIILYYAASILVATNAHDKTYYINVKGTPFI